MFQLLLLLFFSLTNINYSLPYTAISRMNQIREIIKINEEELSRGIAGTSASWHTQYANSAWVFVGNLDQKLTEGDVIAVLSEYGEIDDFNLVREEDTGKSKGFAFCKYEDNRSCVIAVDNLCGYQLCGRSLRVDHVESYRLPKHLQEKEEELQQMLLKKQGLQGHAYEGKEMANEFNLQQGQDVFAKPVPTKQQKNGDLLPPEDVMIDTGNQKRKEDDKRKRKEEKRRAKEERRRERERIRMEREERRREQRAKKMKEEDGAENGDYKDREDDDDESRDDRKHKKKKHHKSKSREHKSKKSEKDRERRKRKRSSRSRSRSPARKKSSRSSKERSSVSPPAEIR